MKLVVEKPSPLAATELVVCEKVEGRDFGCVWHHHPECELIMINRGGTERWVGDKLTPLNPGEILFIGSGVPHDFRNTPTGKGKTRMVEALVIQFFPNLLGEGWLQCPTMEPVRMLFDRASRGLEITGSTRAKVGRQMRQIFQISGLPRVAKLLDLLNGLSQSEELKEIASPGFQFSAERSSADRISKVCHYIEKNITQPILVPKLALKVGLSESAFSRLFKKCTGRTVPQYVNELRIGCACRLLAETDLTVGEIAAASGYRSLANFQRQFHKYQKRSPLTYQKAVRGTGVGSVYTLNS